MENLILQNLEDERASLLAELNASIDAHYGMEPKSKYMSSERHFIVWDRMHALNLKIEAMKNGETSK